ERQSAAVELQAVAGPVGVGAEAAAGGGRQAGAVQAQVAAAEGEAGRLLQGPPGATRGVQLQARELPAPSGTLLPDIAGERNAAQLRVGAALQLHVLQGAGRRQLDPVQGESRLYAAGAHLQRAGAPRGGQPAVQAEG